jgi:hypothetical protein
LKKKIKEQPAPQPIAPQALGQMGGVVPQTQQLQTQQPQPELRPQPEI